MVMKYPRVSWFAAVFVMGLTTGSRAESRPKFQLFGSVGNEAHLVSPNEGSPLNPGNFLDIQKRTDSSDVTVFGDLAPESKSWKVHLKLRGSGEWQRAAYSRVDLGELYANFSVTPWLDVQFGRKIEKWGTGYAWNPTGVVNPPKSPTDPNDRLSAYRGVDVAGVDLYFRDWNITLLGVPQIDWNGRGEKRLAGTGWAARAYRFVGGVDLSLVFSGGSGLSNTQGVSLSKVVGNALEVHAEAAHVDDTLRYVPVCGQSGSLAGRPWELVRREHLDLLLGGQYTFAHNVNLILEYYHTGNGLSPSEWTEFRNHVQTGQEEMSRGNPIPLLISNLYFTPMGMGRDYTFSRISWPVRLNKFDLELIAITSLRDGSSLLRPGVYYRIRPDWQLYWIPSAFVGGSGTEFGQVQVGHTSDFGLRYSF